MKEVGREKKGGGGEKGEGRRGDVGKESHLKLSWPLSNLHALYVLFPVISAAPFLPCLSSKLLVFPEIFLLEMCSCASLPATGNDRFSAFPLHV